MDKTLFMYNIKEEGRSDNSLKGMKKASRD